MAVAYSSIAIYGPPKIGKTLDVAATFSRAFFLLADPGGLTSVKAHLGYTPPHVELINLDDPFGEIMRAIDQQVVLDIKAGKHTAIVIDTMSELADRILNVEDRLSKGNARQSYPKTAQKIKAITRKLLMFPIWFVGIFHEQEPIADESGYIKGSLALPGSKLPFAIAGMFSTVIHAVAMPGMTDSGRVYTCNSVDPHWVSGDRTGACMTRQDMDLRPIVWRMTHGEEPMPEWQPKVKATKEQQGGTTL